MKKINLVGYILLLGLSVICFRRCILWGEFSTLFPFRRAILLTTQLFGTSPNEISKVDVEWDFKEIFFHADILTKMCTKFAIGSPELCYRFNDSWPYFPIVTLVNA